MPKVWIPLASQDRMASFGAGSADAMESAASPAPCCWSWSLPGRSQEAAPISCLAPTTREATPFARNCRGLAPNSLEAAAARPRTPGRLTQIDPLQTAYQCRHSKDPPLDVNRATATNRESLGSPPLEPVMTLIELLAHSRVRGLCVGQCVDGSPLAADVYAHAHQYPRDSNRGWICIRSPRDVLKRGSRELSTTVMHELAHLVAIAGHDDDWRKTMRELGQPIPAAYRKRNKTRPRRP
jgi:hypothetical protein